MGKHSIACVAIHIANFRPLSPIISSPIRPNRRREDVPSHKTSKIKQSNNLDFQRPLPNASLPASCKTEMK